MTAVLPDGYRSYGVKRARFLSNMAAMSDATHWKHLQCQLRRTPTVWEYIEHKLGVVLQNTRRIGQAGWTFASRTGDIEHGFLYGSGSSESAQTTPVAPQHLAGCLHWSVR